MKDVAWSDDNGRHLSWIRFWPSIRYPNMPRILVTCRGVMLKGQRCRKLYSTEGLVAAGDGKEVRAAAMIWDTGSKTGEVSGHTKQARSRHPTENRLEKHVEVHYEGRCSLRPARSLYGSFRSVAFRRWSLGS